MIDNYYNYFSYKFDEEQYETSGESGRAFRRKIPLYKTL